MSDNVIKLSDESRRLIEPTIITVTGQTVDVDHTARLIRGDVSKWERKNEISHLLYSDISIM